ncbi:MAG: RloB domain-containing protein [Phycisphaerales bacterium]|nr:RloB domain-containing protein [Phycisphaerales bacterium]
MARQRRDAGARRPAKPIFVIACEDGKSAPAYLRCLFRLFDHVQYIPAKTGTSGTAPQQVVDRATRALEALEGGERDQAWAVIDAEPQTPHRAQQISAVRSIVRLAVSNPCFEHWIHLHICDVDGSCSAARDKVRLLQQDWTAHKCGGSYQKGTANFDQLVTRERIRQACERAERQLSAKHATQAHLCQACATDFFRLVRAIEELVDS